MAGLLGLVACSSAEPSDASTSDAGQGTDAARDSGQRDAAPSDLGGEDSTPVDTGVEVDAGADAGADAGHEDAAAIDAGDPCARTGLASFQISNLPPGFVLPAINGATPVVGPQTFNTDNGALGGGGSIGTSTTSSVAGGPRVLHVTSLTVSAGTEFILSGNRPLIIVADDTVTIAGTIRTPQLNTTSGLGGWASPIDPGTCAMGTGCPTMGLGPGGGGPGPQSGIGGGGAGYCGLGGAGSNGGVPGMTYGNAEIIPLIGGSSGGSATQGNGPSGPGGGALQIVAGTAIVIERSGVITMAGAGGYAGATGAGSGGSIVLEAPSITVRGALAANGGGGGASSLGSADIGAWGTITSTPAAGGGRGGERGGAGGAGSVADGRDGVSAMRGSGGGGGAGRVRLNTACGAVDTSSTAVLSPDRSTGCATSGSLASP